MIATVFLIFVAVFLSVWALFLVVHSARESGKLKRRLQRIESADEWLASDYSSGDLLRDSETGDSFISRLTVMKRMKRLIDQSGVEITPLRLLILPPLIAAVAFLFSLMLLKASASGALVLAIVLGSLPFGYLAFKKLQRLKRFGEQLPDALTMIARSLRAGHSLAGAVELVSQELPEPSAGLFRIAYEQQKLGMRMAASLATLLDKVDSMDLNFFVTIIKINSETGGNLAEILDGLSDTIRSRLQIRRQVQVYTAEGRLSGYVLVLMPIIVFAVFYQIRPEYMQLFFTDKGCQTSLMVAAGAQCVGFLVIRKIIDIRI